MQPKLLIRKATRADRSTVLTLHRELYIHYRDEITRPEVLPLFAYKDIEATLRDDVEGLLHARDTTILLAQRAERAVGYVTGHIEQDARRVLPKKGVVEDWFVVPDERGHGTGKLLLDTLIEWFRAASCDVVESGTWAFNEGARRAHARAGFAEIEVKFRRKL